MTEKLPTYKITIDPAYSDGEELGVEQIAFTSRPAIKMKGLAFSAVEKKKFFTDNVKMRIAAPAMIPMEIYRADDDGEYYVEFTPEVIEQLHSKFMLNLTNNGKFNLEHDTTKTVPAYVLEAWIVDEPLKDKSYSTYGMTVPKGTLMVVSQVTDKAYYDSLVANEQVGYSIEGFLGMKLSELAIAQELINKNNRTNEMTLPNGTKFTADGKNWIFNDGKIEEDKTAPVAAAVSLFEVPLEDGTSIFIAISNADGKTAVKGDAVFTDKEGKVIAEAKDYVTKDGSTITVADGKVADIKIKTPAEEVAAAEPVVAPEPVVTPEATTVIDEAAILAVVQPKLDEIYKMLADIKAAIAEEEVIVPEANPANTQMSIHDRFSAVMKIVGEK